VTRNILNASFYRLRLSNRNSVSFVYASAVTSPDYEVSGLAYAGLDGNYRTQIAVSFNDDGKTISIRTCNGEDRVWNPWMQVLTSAAGSISYLNGAFSYQTSPTVWQGSVSFAEQLQNNAAPIFYACWLR